MATGRIIRNVAVDDLGHGNGAILSKEVKDLVFDACLVQRQPGVVGPGQLAIRRVGLLCLLGNGLDGRWAIDGLLGAGDVGQPDESSFPLAIVIRFLVKPWRGGQGRMAGLVPWGPDGGILTAALPS